MTHKGVSIMTKNVLIASAAALLLAGCQQYQINFSNPEENYLSFSHPFTDSATAEVQAKAAELCAQRKKAVIQTTKSCSLSKSTTNFQCLAQDDTNKYGL